MKKSVAFDVDGTLFDTHNIAMESINEFSEIYGYKKIPESDYERIRSQPTGTTIRKDLAIPLKKIPLFYRDINNAMIRKYDNVKPFKGIDKVLNYLSKKANVLRGIITTNNSKKIPDYLEKYNMNVFDYIKSGCMVGTKPIQIRQILKKYKIDKHNFFYVGDEVYDTMASKVAGVNSIAVTWGYNHSNCFIKTKPDYLVNNPKSLLRCFKKLKL